MSFYAKRELLAQTAPRYQAASPQQKSIILDEFVAATGYARKYAIRLLARPVVPPAPITRPRAPRYGPAVQDALRVAWEAANRICAKRLVPFLPDLVPILEQHGHLSLSDETRALLLSLSAATAERIFQRIRRAEAPQRISTTKAGTLLKQQVPIRTFAGWDDATPGFLEADLVAHAGGSAEGAFLYTLVLTDIATGWTECLPLLQRSQHAVIQALEHARRLLPFPLLGFDTDNGSEFINREVIAYCEREHLTFTRGRPARKNDQCFVEQKNGVIVRQFVGYDRFVGERAYCQLTELYRALRWYVNGFQPSMKLVAKVRDGSRVTRRYDQAQTPWQRVQASGVLDDAQQTRLAATYQALDPVRLLQQIGTLQRALWRLAVLPHAPMASAGADQAGPQPDVRFDAAACGSSEPETAPNAPDEADTPAPHQQRYHRFQRAHGPRWWRTRTDPFAEVWDEVVVWLQSHPEQTVVALLRELQERYPGQFPDGQLRTLQRKVSAWRAENLVTFTMAWLDEDGAANGQPESS